MPSLSILGSTDSSHITDNWSNDATIRGNWPLNIGSTIPVTTEATDARNNMLNIPKQSLSGMGDIMSPTNANPNVTGPKLRNTVGQVAKPQPFSIPGFKSKGAIASELLWVLGGF